jgi:predicted TIM-barrel fold metal-dependent hydrolase
MNFKAISLSVVATASILIFLVGVSGQTQTVPLADHHAHLQSPSAARLLNQGASHGSQGPAGPEEEKPSTASELITQLNAGGIQRSVAVSDSYRLGSPFVHVPREAAAVDAENEWTLQQVKMYPDRLVGFCSVNPVRPYALAAIEHCADIGLRGGLKLHLANGRFSFANPAHVEQLRKVFAAAERLGMPILIHLRTDETWDGWHNVQVFLEKVLPLASHVPVQVAHLGGWGGYDQTTDDTLSAFAKACEDDPNRCRNLYFDISAVVLSPASARAAPGSDERLLWDEQKDFAEGPERLATSLRRVGLSRILFGTDWPNETAINYFGTLRHGLRLSPTEINQILSNIAPYFLKQVR